MLVLVLNDNNQRLLEKGRQRCLDKCYISKMKQEPVKVITEQCFTHINKPAFEIWSCFGNVHFQPRTLGNILACGPSIIVLAPFLKGSCIQKWRLLVMQPYLPRLGDTECVSQQDRCARHFNTLKAVKNTQSPNISFPIIFAARTFQKS